MQQQLMSLPVLQTSGTVEAVMPGWIKIVSGADQSWILQVLPTAKCQLTGKAKADFLTQGYFIRFIGEVNKRGAVEQKVAKVTIFTPSQTRMPGAEPDSGLGTSFGPRPGDERKAGQGAKPAFGAAGDLGGRKAGAGAGAGGKAGGSEVFDVRGQIVGAANGRLSLQVPTTLFRQSLRLEVAEDADIDVELDDPMSYTLARKGDKVRVQGRQGMGNRGFAEDLDIILSEPLGAPQREGKKYAAKGAKGKRGAEADESADGKAEKKDSDAPTKPKKAGAGKADDSDAKKSDSADDSDSSESGTKKRSKTADADAPEKPAKKKTKKPAKRASDDDAPPSDQ